MASDFMDRDILGLASDDLFTTITLLAVRSGFLKGARTFYFNETMASETELMESFIKQYYEKSNFLPKEILLSIPIPSADILEDVLYTFTQKRIHIKYPVRGEKTTGRNGGSECENSSHGCKNFECRFQRIIEQAPTTSGLAAVSSTYRVL